MYLCVCVYVTLSTWADGGHGTPVARTLSCRLSDFVIGSIGTIVFLFPLIYTDVSVESEKGIRKFHGKQMTPPIDEPTG